MHEASLAMDLLRRVREVAEAQGVSKVVVVRLRVGPLLHVSGKHLREHFALASRGTVAEGAELVMEVVGAKEPHCQGLVLESLEVEEA